MTSTRTGTHRRWWQGVAAVGAGVMLLASCTAGSDTAGEAVSSSAVSSSAAAAPSLAPGSGATASSAAASGSAGGVAADGGVPGSDAAGTGIPALDTRKIVRTADLQVRLDLPADTTDEALEQAQQDALDAAVNRARSQLLALGGFVAELQQAGGSASLVLRVPVDNYDAFRAGAQEWGEVTSSTESAQDVTDEYTDVESRIASMQTSVDRIRTLLSQATAVADIITIESELSRREADLESLEGRRVVLADQVSLGTVSVTLSALRLPADTVVASQEPDRGGFLGGLAAGWDGLTAFLTGVGVVVGAVLPFVPLVALVVLVAWAVRRAVRRRRAAPTAPSPRVDQPTPA